MSTSKGTFDQDLSDASTEVSPNMTPIRTSDDGDKLFPPATQGDLQEKAVQADAAEGGWKAWVQVFACFLIFFNTWGFIDSFGVFETYYITLLSKTPSTIAWIGAVSGFTLVVPGIIVGALHDRGYFRYLVVTGSFLVVLGLMMTSICNAWWHFFISQGICVGIGGAMAFFPSVSVLASYFEHNPAMAIGVATSGANLGAVIYPVMFRNLVPNIGFGWTVRIMAFMALTMLTLANLLQRPRKSLYPPSPLPSLLDTSAIHDLPYLTFTTSMFCVLMGVLQPLYFAPTYAVTTLSIPPSSAFYITVLMNGCAVLGCLLPPLLTLRFSMLSILTAGTFCAAVLGYAWIAVASAVGFYVLVSFYGFFTGVIISIPTAVLAGLSPRRERVGARVGMAFTVAAFGLLVGSPVGGLLVDLENRSFVKLQVWAASLLAGAGVLMGVTWWLQGRKEGRVGVEREGAGRVIV